MNNNMANKIKGISINAKNELTAIWISKERHSGLKTLDFLFLLDDEYERVYNENRIKVSFSQAAVLGYKAVLDIIYS